RNQLRCNRAWSKNRQWQRLSRVHTVVVVQRSLANERRPVPGTRRVLLYAIESSIVRKLIAHASAIQEVKNSVAAAQRCPRIAEQVIREADPRCQVVLVRVDQRARIP